MRPKDMQKDSDNKIKVSDEVLAVLTKISKSLPHGYRTELCKKVDKSDEYLRQFFKGWIPIDSENAKIIETANKMLDKDATADEKAEAKVLAIGAEIIAKTSKPETEF